MKLDCWHFDSGLARHLHGTDQGYQLDGCRCGDCRAAAAAAARRRRRARAEQEWAGTYDRLVPAGPAARHLQLLRRQGMTTIALAKLAGTDSGNIWRISSGANGRVRESLAVSILAISQPVHVGRGLIGATASSRRLRALVARGWVLAALCERAGVNRSTGSQLINEKQVWVHAATHDAIERVYDELWDVEPPPRSDRACRGRASTLQKTAAGWAPPAAWDDDRIFDPSARPSGRRVA